MCKSARTIALGFCVGQPCLLRNGRIRAPEARELERAWLAGYDRGGALYFADSQESKIPETAWRPARSIVLGTRLGVLWHEQGPSGPEIVIFHDGIERVRLRATGRLPGLDKDLFAVVDVQGAVKSVCM